MSEELKIKDGYFKVRPAGRHIVTIGRDLIKDKYAAIVELVKNSFDADSSYCKISLLPFEKQFERDGELIIDKGIRIIIKDEGHGMSFETVTEKWMVPSTNDKFNRVESPNGRIMQGKKGIGRYSASLLGDDLVLETIDSKGELTTLYLIWDDFENAKYLEDVDVLIENFNTNRGSGTEIIIVGNQDHLNSWDVKEIRNLMFELKKLIPPKDKDLKLNNYDVENFRIEVELGNFPFIDLSNVTETIEPYPILELFDYRISGTVSADGIANLRFENKRIPNSTVEEIKNYKIWLNQENTIFSNEAFQKYCGEVKFDFRVFDRDANSIDGLIERGLKDPITNQYVGKREARRILDQNNGIGVYRNGFRLRPLGDAGYDWLSLDNQRVQKPSMRVGCDQVIGFIHIQSELESGLEEKSARDGLKESQEYFGLRETSRQVLSLLENRRFAYRKTMGLGRANNNVNAKVDKLYNFEELQNNIERQLIAFGVSTDNIVIIKKLISDKEQENNSVANDLKQIIALYQGQATLGKIVNVIMHEGRKPLGYLRNQIPTVVDWTNILEKNYTKELQDKIIDRLYVIGEQGKLITELFKKLDPLSAKRNKDKAQFKLKPVIENVKGIFQSELSEKDIQLEITCEDDILLFGWKEDLSITFANLIENSIYWLQTNEQDKLISINAFKDESDVTIIEYRDNGPGIEKVLIESEIIFEPEFSNKPGGGTGLGLAIAGEAINRNNGTLKAIYSESGVFFKVEIITNPI